MHSRTICRTVSPDLDRRRAVIADLEQALWAGGFDESVLARYQAAHRALEQAIAEAGADDRHRFLVVVPVADRPRHLKNCLDSLLEQCRVFGYGGRHAGRFRKVAVLIADDSREPDNMEAHRALAGRCHRLGLDTTYFGLDEQRALLARLGEAGRARLTGMLGNVGADATGHKGATVMRNLAFLKLATSAADDDRLLIHAIDSDQEFKVKVRTPDGDRNVQAVSFFHALDAIFRDTGALMLTGKVVGDPPVSPAVMAGNFLDDVIAFLQRAAGAEAEGPCRHHETDSRREGEAAYHDMADLFGFHPPADAYPYRCTLAGPHSEADCFDHFAARLTGFFYGEHPTRVSYYQYAEALASVRPARTVYTGNYVLRPEALRYFVPFAAQRLRMAGPSLGRIVRAEIGDRFVSANLPMLHKRTVEGIGRSEFRSGVEAGPEAVELCGEFERQFHGDVMLFALERLTALGFPLQTVPDDAVAVTVETVHGEILERYLARQEAVAGRLERLKDLLRDPSRWWNRAPARAAALTGFESFVAGVEHNFGPDSPCHARIREDWPRRRNELVKAIVRYPQDRLAWEAALAASLV